jgi:hypothetical protein
MRHSIKQESIGNKNYKLNQLDLLSCHALIDGDRHTHQQALIDGDRHKHQQEINEI